MGMEELKLKQEIVTQWSSCLLIFEILLEVKEALITALFYIVSLTNPTLDTFTKSEWIAMNEGCQALKIFEEITEEMSSQKAVTILLSV